MYSSFRNFIFFLKKIWIIIHLRILQKKKNFLLKLFLVWFFKIIAQPRIRIQIRPKSWISIQIQCIWTHNTALWHSFRLPQNGYQSELSDKICNYSICKESPSAAESLLSCPPAHTPAPSSCSPPAGRRAGRGSWCSSRRWPPCGRPPSLQWMWPSF